MCITYNESVPEMTNEEDVVEIDFGIYNIDFTGNDSQNNKMINGGLMRINIVHNL